MDEKDILEKIQSAARKTLKNDGLILKGSEKFTEVEGWTSLTHMMIIADIEKTFNIKFKLKDIKQVKDIGALVMCIKGKLA
jgi:acyl carrier protein